MSSLRRRAAFAIKEGFHLEEFLYSYCFKSSPLLSALTFYLRSEFSAKTFLRGRTIHRSIFSPAPPRECDQIFLRSFHCGLLLHFQQFFIHVHDNSELPILILILFVNFQVTFSESKFRERLSYFLSF